MKKIILVASVVAVLLVAGIIIKRSMFDSKEDIWICQDGKWEQRGNPKEPQPSTGCGDPGEAVVDPMRGLEEDHGCQVAAGYGWCPSKEKCQRMWEEYCEEFKGQFRVNSFETCVAANNPVEESDPRGCRSENGELFKEGIEGSSRIESTEQAVQNESEDVD